MISPDEFLVEIRDIGIQVVLNCSFMTFTLYFPVYSYVVVRKALYHRTVTTYSPTAYLFHPRVHLKRLVAGSTLLQTGLILDSRGGPRGRKRTGGRKERREQRMMDTPSF